MKQLCFLFLLTFSIANAQTPHVRKGLTDAELQTAKALYVKMLESDTNKQKQQLIKKQVELSNGVLVPSMGELAKHNLKPEDYKGEDGIKKLYTDFWTMNVGRTKFASVEEAVDIHMQGLNLQMKLREENPELYKYMADATMAQLRELKQIDIDASRQRLYDRLEERSRKQ
ncbi:MAG: hypothetical protein ACO1N9_10695 [Flavobacterium sp.]